VQLKKIFLFFILAFKASVNSLPNLGVGRIFPGGPPVGSSKLFSRRGQKWWNLFFPTRN